MDLKKINLVLDLDETLIKCLKEKVESPSFLGLFIIENTPHYIYQRELLENFLEEMVGVFNVYIYSNGTRDYVNNICKMIKNANKIKGIFSREYSDNYIKNLERVGLKKEDTIILDDRMDVWNEKYQPCVIPILPFSYQYGRFWHSYELKYIKYKIYDIYNRYIMNYKFDKQNDITLYM